MRIGILLALLVGSLGLQAPPVSITYPEKPGAGRGRPGVFVPRAQE